MEGPDSSYSCLEIHICWKVEREAKMDPPIQTEYLRSEREGEEKVEMSHDFYVKILQACS